MAEKKHMIWKHNEFNARAYVRGEKYYRVEYPGLIWFTMLFWMVVDGTCRQSSSFHRKSVFFLYISVCVRHRSLYLLLNPAFFGLFFIVIHWECPDTNNQYSRAIRIHVALNYGANWKIMSHFERNWINKVMNR